MTISAVTIGGIAATIAVQASAANGELSAVAIAQVPSGSLATVAWTDSATVLKSSASAYTITGPLNSSTATFTGSWITATGGNPIVATTTLGYGLIFGGHIANIGSTTYTWTNATKDYDHNTGGGVDVGETAAHGAFLSAQSALSVQAQPSGTIQGAMVVAAFH